MEMNWICLDIETANAPEGAIIEAMAAWRPPGNCTKADTIEQKRQEAEARYREKAALLDASPVICLAMQLSDGPSILFHSFRKQYSVPGWLECASPDERTMLLVIREYLNAQGGDPSAVGHNIRGFDLPKLRQAFIRHRLRLPKLFRIRADDEPPLKTADTMHMIRFFSMELRDEKFISLDQVAMVLGIEQPKKLVSGSMVPSLYRDERYQEILTYCAIDAATTARAFALMTNQAPDLA